MLSLNVYLDCGYGGFIFSLVRILKNPFGTWYFISARSLNGFAYGQSECFECRFSAMMIVLATENIDVQGDTSGHGEGVEDVRDHFC